LPILRNPDTFHIRVDAIWQYFSVTDQSVAANNRGTYRFNL